MALTPRLSTATTPPPGMRIGQRPEAPAFTLPSRVTPQKGCEPAGAEQGTAFDTCQRRGANFHWLGILSVISGKGLPATTSSKIFRTFAATSGETFRISDRLMPRPGRIS